MAGRIQVTAEVVGIGSDGTEPSVVFAVHRRGVYSAEQTLLKRYLFNCGEGTQRLCGENGIKLTSLDSIFLTRLDVQSASGIPGLVFALGGIGAAQLKIHGPPGTRDRLGAMQSFVRRKYPRVECVEVGSELASSSAKLDPDIPRSLWLPGEAQEDQHASIVALSIGDRGAKEETETETNNCWVCTSCSALAQRRDVISTSSVAVQSGVDEDDPDRVWLRRFYVAKGMKDKISHMDAILGRFRGRMDDLKSQLTAKYGALDGDSSSSSSSDSSSEDEEEEAAKSVFNENAPLDREWLEAFYQRHEPVKVARIDQVLRQFAGREDQLKAMLLAKYGTSQSETTSEPPVKKHKTQAPIAAVAAEEGNSPEELPEVYVGEGEATSDEASGAHDKTPSICYVLQFRSPPYPIVWVVDCKTTEHTDEVARKLSATSGCSHRPSLVIHFTPLRVLRDPRYQAWISTLHGANGDGFQNLIFDGRALREANGGVFSFAFPSSARHYLKNRSSDGLPLSSRWNELHQLFDDEVQQARKAPLQLRILKQLAGSQIPAHVAQAKLKYVLQEQATAEYSQTGWKYVVDKKAQAQGDEEEGDEIPVTTTHPVITNSQSPRSLTILGTGSAAPSKFRASTSMYLSLSREPVDGKLPGMLIDCGEGAYGQLQRHSANDEELTSRMAGLQCIWISHHHADHQCGLLRVLDEYVRLTHSTSSALFVIAPKSVLEYATAWLPGLPPRIVLATCSDLNDNASLRDAVCRGMIRDLRSVRVWHCYDSYGLVLTLQDGTKFVYSGDTKPCDQLVCAGLDASLLVHEATFDDTMEDDADRKKHSTVGQALEVARRMRAQRVVLTHFSQRYPALPPPMAAETTPHASPMAVDCAYDGVTIRF